MPRRRMSRPRRATPVSAAVADLYLEAIHPYLASPISLRSWLPRSTKVSDTSKRLRSHGVICPYDIRPLPYAPSSSNWDSVENGAALVVFRYEAWLRSRRVWRYVRSHPGSRLNPHHTIGGVPLLNLEWLLEGGHHSLLTRTSDVRDLSAELLYFGPGLFSEIGQGLLKDAVLVSEIIETAQLLWEDEPAEELYLRIAATGNPKKIQKEIQQILEERQRRLKASKFHAQDVAEISHRGRSLTPRVAARRLNIWDLRHARIPLTFEEIGKQFFPEAYKKHPFEAAKLVDDDLKHARQMIEAAETGQSRPAFRKRRRIPLLQRTTRILSVLHFSAIPDLRWIAQSSPPSDNASMMDGRTDPLQPKAVGKAAIAQAYSVSTKTVDRWLDQGLPYLQQTPRSKVLIRLEDIEGLLKRRVRPPINLDELVAETAAELAHRQVPQMKKATGKR